MSVIQYSNPFHQLPKATKGLLMANVVGFMATILLPREAYQIFALQPQRVLQDYWIWQLLTYSFLHGNWWHLFFNMFALWMFGPHVEGAMSSPRFLRYYFSCVLGAAVSQLLVAPTEIVVGASGGIYGILLAFGLLFPDTIIYLFLLLPFRAFQAVLFIALITLVSAVGSGVGTRVAHLAHLGGMLTGFLIFKVPLWWQRFPRWKPGFGILSKRRRPLDSFTVIEGDDLKKEVDRILDKISAKGIESLTPEEHKMMQRYAKNRN